MKAMINSGDGIVGIDEQPDDIIVILMIILLWYKDKMKNREKITGDGDLWCLYKNHIKVLGDLIYWMTWRTYWYVSWPVKIPLIYLNIVDNTPKDDSHNKDEKLFKIWPVMEVVRNNYVDEHEQTNSSDEEIISTKIKRSGILK